MKSIVRSSSLVAVLLVVGSAHAQETPAAPAPRSIFVEKPTAVRAVFGPFGSPTGVLGVEVERSLASWFALRGGVGLGGLPDKPNPQLAAGGSLMPLHGENWGVGAAASLSFGKYRELGGIDDEDENLSGRVFWTNVEAFGSFRFKSGVDLRFALGASIDTACGGAGCRGSEAYNKHRRLGDGNQKLGYTTIGVGYAF